MFSKDREILDDDELIVDSKEKFDHVMADFGADGMVWVNKKFIRDYVAAMQREIYELEKEVRYLNDELKMLNTEMNEYE